MSVGRWRPYTVTGSVSSSLQKRMAKKFNETSLAMLEEAITHWRASNWPRYSDDEDDCTVQIVLRLLDLKRLGAYHHVEVTHEYQQLSPDIRAGREKARRAKRPDVRLTANHAAPTVVECKRLLNTKAMCDKYVANGLARFVEGTYIVDDSGLALMIGYCSDKDSFDPILTMVNNAIAAHESMGPLHKIDEHSRSTHLLQGRSSHGGNSHVTHVRHQWIQLGT